MAFDDRLITVAIHTCERALALKDKLERAGIYVTLQNINLEHPVVASGMRVRIRENELAKALLIIENDAPDCSESVASQRQEILVPVDFSPYSLEACLVACNIAAAHGATVTILYSYYTPVHAAATQLSDALTYDRPVPESSEEALELARRQLQGFLTNLSHKLPKAIADKVRNKTVILRGLPEEVINQYSKENSPMLIVMGTRGTGKKERDLVGSVTAEVLDTCRRPVLTVPEGYTADGLGKTSSVLYFCNGEQCDILAIQRLHELIGAQLKKITLVHLATKRNNISEETILSLKNYCTEHYHQSEFEASVVPVSTSDSLMDKENPAKSLIVIPNRRKSAFARLFNPGMAHRLLFKADIPMLVIPV